MNAFGMHFLTAVGLDLALGDPRWLPHPVAGIGSWASKQETWWRRTSVPLRWAGIGAWFAVVIPVAVLVHWSANWAPQTTIYWIFSFLALRSLDQHAVAVVRPLQTGDLEAARRAVGMIVGRDTGSLTESEVTRALIETVAENANDGVVAPLFWLGIGGAEAMAVYKAINTLDSMFGHRDQRYREFGWWSARADDVASWIPARLTAALFLLVAAVWPGLDARRSWRTVLRDAHRQPSPNSGYPEAAAAGALGVQLGGVNFYGGVAARKEPLGDAQRPLSWRAYSGMRVLLYGSALLCSAAVFWGRGWH